MSICRDSWLVIHVSHFPAIHRAYDYDDLFDRDPRRRQAELFRVLSIISTRDIINRRARVRANDTRVEWRKRRDASRLSMANCILTRSASFLTIVYIFPRSASATTPNAPERRGIILYVSGRHLHVSLYFCMIPSLIQSLAEEYGVSYGRNRSKLHFCVTLHFNSLQCHAFPAVSQKKKGTREHFPPPPQQIHFRNNTCFSLRYGVFLHWEISHEYT